MLALSFCFAQDIQAAQEYLISSLSFGEFEKKRLNEIRNSFVKCESLAALIALKTLTDDLASNLDLNIIREKDGKPCFESAPLFFSLSHSSGLATAVLSDSPVGIDIEAIDSHRKFSGVAKRFFSPSECEQINLSKSPADTFYSLWTQKEAFSKISGTGVLAEFYNGRQADNQTLIKEYRVSFNNSDFALSVCAQNSTDTSVMVYPYKELQIYELQNRT